MEFEKSGKLVSFSTKVREISMFFHLKVREISIFWLKSQGSLILKFCGNPDIVNLTSIIDFYKRKEGINQLHTLECLEFISDCLSHLNLMQQERVLCWNVNYLFLLECALLFN